MKPKHWGTIALLAAIFILPVIAAWFLYLKAGDWQLATTNRGILLQPPLTVVGELATEDWRGKWLLLYVDSHCTDLCKQSAINLAEVNLVLSKESSRIRSVLATLPLSETADETDAHGVQQAQQLNPHIERVVLTAENLQQLLTND
ncbi:MAG: hypothetical protein GKR77_03905, partial [Legionellales bacterium]|nr:hypothetical protein [Legionellales bacterium]